jgi:uncharacterized delta-60 repeat protein
MVISIQAFLLELVFNNTIRSIKIQSDGKILVAGEFTSYNGTGANRIIRINSDGSIDTGFTYGTGFNARVYDIKLQSDGKILVAGEFTTYNGSSVDKLIRLNSDGSLDTGYTTSQTANCFTIDIDSNGKAIVLNQSTSNGGIRRYNTDGTNDTGFDPDTGFSGNASKILVLSDDSVVCIGSFVEYRGNTVNNVVKINTNGTFNSTFRSNIDGGSGGGFTNPPNFIIKLPSNNILIGGGNSGSRPSGLVKCSENGTKDTAFPQIQSGTSATTAVVQSDNKVIVSGDFISVGSTDSSHLVRITTSNTLDTTYTTSGGRFIGLVDAKSTGLTGGGGAAAIYGYVDRFLFNSSSIQMNAAQAIEIKGILTVNVTREILFSFGTSNSSNTVTNYKGGILRIKDIT